MISRKLKIRESQIEDVLATYPDITRDILGTKEDLTLLSRQKILPSGNKLDLLFVSGMRLILLELKVEMFQKQFLRQTLEYKKDLMKLQSDQKLVKGEVDAYLLCPLISDLEIKSCQELGIHVIRYSPEFVLNSFYARLKSMAEFMNIRLADHGLWNLHLLNRLLYFLDEAKTQEDLAKETHLSKSTIGSYLRLAEELCLVRKNERKHFSLTDIGKKYFWNRDPKAPIEHISDAQAETIRNFIVGDPFASRSIFGIYTIVEVVFTLSRNTYPVPIKMVVNHFRDSSGKFFEWPTIKSAVDGTKMYSNYAAELGLIGQIGNKFYITPDGVRFILLLQLHRSIKVVDALGIPR